MLGYERARSSSEVPSWTAKILAIHVNAFNSSAAGFGNVSLASSRTGQSRPWSDRYLFSAFNASQQLSTLFNTLQRISTSAILAMLKRVEHLPPVTSEPPQGRRRDRRGGSHSHCSSPHGSGARSVPGPLTLRAWPGSRIPQP